MHYFCVISLMCSLTGCFTCIFAGDSGVTQTSRILWAQKGKYAEITCNHDKGGFYFHMYWFRQQQEKPMVLIVYTSTTSELDYGNFSQEKFSVTKERGESGSFTVKNVESDDSALYFCAVSEHSDTVLLHC
uniref:Ig-like domain-containing protein n=1 Tax=Pygocentrus nattereri TaxID=42514 RepID=A0AAR2KTU0_PYGNA